MLTFENFIHEIESTGLVDTSDMETIKRLEEINEKAGDALEWLIRNRKELSFSIWLVECDEFAGLLESIAEIEDFTPRSFDHRHHRFTQQFKSLYQIYQHETRGSLLWCAQSFDDALVDFVYAADLVIPKLIEEHRKVVC